MERGQESAPHSPLYSAIFGYLNFISIKSKSVTS